MATWNFRVIKNGEQFAIHYAYYSDDGQLESLSESPASPLCDDQDDLCQTLRLMLEACEDAVVDFGTLHPLKT
jgi:hypothetical protein